MQSGSEKLQAKDIAEFSRAMDPKKFLDSERASISVKSGNINLDPENGLNVLAGLCDTDKAPS